MLAGKLLGFCSNEKVWPRLDNLCRLAWREGWSRGPTPTLIPQATRSYLHGSPGRVGSTASSPIT